MTIFKMCFSWTCRKTFSTSRHFEVKEMKNRNAECIMKDLTEIFAILRKPIRMNADNDPSFSSRALSDYYEANEIFLWYDLVWNTVAKFRIQIMWNMKRSLKRYRSRF